MAAAGDVEDVEAEEVLETNQKNSVTKDMGNVTKFVEERELDQKRAREALQSVMEAERRMAEERAALEARLRAVAIKKEDVTLIAEEFDLTPAEAERKLREADGDPVRALRLLAELVEA